MRCVGQTAIWGMMAAYVRTFMPLRAVAVPVMSAGAPMVRHRVAAVSVISAAFLVARCITPAAERVSVRDGRLTAVLEVAVRVNWSL